MVILLNFWSWVLDKEHLVLVSKYLSNANLLSKLPIIVFVRRKYNWTGYNWTGVSWQGRQHTKLTLLPYCNKFITDHDDKAVIMARYTRRILAELDDQGKELNPVKKFVIIITEPYLPVL